MREKTRFKNWKDVRNYRKLTAKEVGKKLKLAEQTIYAKEKDEGSPGKRHFTLKEADKLCTIYHIELKQVKNIN